MAISTRPVVRSRQGRAVRPILVLARTLLALSVTGLSYAGLAGAAFGPAAEPLGQEGLPAPKLAEASLSFAGVDPIITGSVAGLFDTPMFAGPNRAEKVNRARLTPDGVTVSGGFQAVWAQLAEARRPKDAAPSTVHAAMHTAERPRATGKKSIRSTPPTCCRPRLEMRSVSEKRSTTGWSARISAFGARTCSPGSSGEASAASTRAAIGSPGDASIRR